MPTPAAVLAQLLRADATRPRVTFYDDGSGERIDLSARVLANWVAKAGNLLQDELDAAPATTVGLDLPAHWRAFYWALAAWSVGATVVVGPPARSADVVVTIDPDTAREVAESARLAVLVSLPMLARVNPSTPPDVVDEARELATHGDVFTAYEEPADADPALVGESEHTFANVVVSQADWGPSPRVRVPDDLAASLAGALSAWAADGSVVLVRAAVGDQTHRLATEGVTLDLS